VAGRERRRGSCQTWMGLVWRATGAVRNARPSRVPSGVHPEEAEWGKQGARTTEVCGWMLVRSSFVYVHVPWTEIHGFVYH